MNRIEASFAGIPQEEILAIANALGEKIKGDPTSVMTKSGGELVTVADLKIQEILIKHFATSAISGSYVLKAEELLSEGNWTDPLGKEFQLIIDPIDGTSSFLKGEESWGTMVGLCDLEGNLLYSWNLVSNGKIFSTSTGGRGPRLNRSFTDRSRTLQIDVFDYGMGGGKEFPAILEAESHGKITSGSVAVTSFPSAVWCGWKLFNGESDGLLWLPSQKGKRDYPDYDLSFLGALKSQGWRIELGKGEDSVVSVVVAPSDEDLEVLSRVGKIMSEGKVREKIRYSRDLNITGAIGSLE